MFDESSKQTQLARTIVRSASTEQKDVLRLWAEGLLRIRSQQISTYSKVAAGVKLTTECHVIGPMLKLARTELKRIGWDERSWKTRLGLGSIVATVVTVGSSSAGVAALGGAIAVPLWILFGAGAAFAGAIIDEVASNSR